MELVVGAILEGKVTGITKFGAFVALPGGKSGLVHISNISDSYVNDINEFLSVGQDVKVKVTNIDQNNRINLSIKHALSPDQKHISDRPSGSQERGGYRERNGYRNNQTNPRSSGGGNGSRGGSGRGRNSAPGGSASREPQTFEDKLKQYMAESESRLSELNRNNDRGRSRRGRRGG